MKVISDIQIKLIKKGYDKDLILSEEIENYILNLIDEDGLAVGITPYAGPMSGHEKPLKKFGYQDYEPEDKPTPKIKVDKLGTIRKFPKVMEYEVSKAQNQDKDKEDPITNQINVFREEGLSSQKLKDLQLVLRNAKAYFKMKNPNNPKQAEELYKKLKLKYYKNFKLKFKSLTPTEY